MTVDQQKREALSKLFEEALAVPLEDVSALPEHASPRVYLRFSGGGKRAVGVIGDNLPENKAFVAFANHFRSCGLPVPEIYAADMEKGIYLQEDFGDTSLWDIVEEGRKVGNHLSEEAKSLYKEALVWLTKFQVDGGKELDYSFCEGEQEFAEKTLIHDMHYFRDRFLVHYSLEFDSDALEKDFKALCEFLLSAKRDCFMYRDFQSRNIMVLKDSLGFIDFQSGRRGPVHYDLVSLLYQSSTQIPQETRDELTEFYLNELMSCYEVKEEEFYAHLSGFILIRALQTLGAYGRRGLSEGKEYFINSIPHGIETVRLILDKKKVEVDMPTLSALLRELTKLSAEELCSPST